MFQVVGLAPRPTRWLVDVAFHCYSTDDYHQPNLQGPGHGQRMRLCSCIGCVGSDPYCPCEMERRGLKATPIGTPEKIAEFKEAIR